MNLGEILGNIGFDWRVALANFVNFLIIFWLLQKLIFKPLGETLNARKKKIEDGLEDSKKAATELMMAGETCKQKISAAKKEADEIVAGAHEQSKNMLAKSEQEAREEASKIKEDARQEIAKEKSKMESEVKNQAVDLAFDMAGKILNKEVDSKTDEKFISGLVAVNEK